MRPRDPNSVGSSAFKAAIDASPDAFITVDRDWRIVYLNRAAAQMFALEGGAVGTELWDAMPDAAEHFQGPFRRALEEARAGEQEAFFPALGRQLLVRYHPSGEELSLCFRDRTTELRREQALVAENRRIEAILDNAADGIVVTDAEGKIQQFNASARKMFGRACSEVIGQSITRLFPPPSNSDASELLRIGTKRISALRADGTRFAVDLTSTAMEVDGERLFVAVMRNIEQQLLAEKELRASRASLARAQEIANLGSWSWDIGTGRLQWSDQIYRIFGLDPQEFSPTYQAFLDRIHPDDRPAVEQAVEKTLQTGTPYSIEHRLVRPDGQWRIVLEQGEVTFENGRPMQMDGVVQDVTERKRAQETIEFMANFDALTGLANRSLMRYRLQRAISQAQREQRLVAVIFLDLDRFKNINNTLGPSAGNAVLNSVARSLSEAVREGDTVARLGGDEFAVILDGIDNVDAIGLLAEKLLNVIRTPVMAAGHEVFPSATIGITVFPHDGREVESLFRNADAALNRAKQDKLGTYQFFTPDMTAVAVSRMRLERDLRRAVLNREFEIRYHPQLDSQRGEVVGVEALLRWNHPKEGLIAPGKFIPLLEETGLIIAVGEQVLEQACREAQQWNARGIPLRMAVNLSAVQFRQGDLAEQVVRALNRSGLGPNRLELEITESILIENVQQTVDTLRELNAHGIKISIDDFGTGYSSMSYLQRFPVHALKIDRSFVRTVTEERESATITKAIIALARSLKLKVVAEGVETPEQLDFLRQNGCDEVQGYLFTEPLSPEQLVRWVESRQGKLIRQLR